MINDRIRHIAQGLADLAVSFKREHFNNAMGGSNPAEALRGAFLSLKQRHGVGDAVCIYAQEFFELLNENDGVADSLALLMIDIVGDPDMLTVPERPQAWQALVDGQKVAGMAKYPVLMAFVDRVWAPTLSGAEAAKVWSKVLLCSDDAQADRVLARTDVDSIPFELTVAGSAIRNVRALDLLVGRMSLPAIGRAIEALCQRIEVDDEHLGSLDDALLVLAAHHVARAGVEDGIGARVLSLVLKECAQDIEAPGGCRAAAHLADLGLATGLQSDPRFFFVLAESAVRAVPLLVLQRLVEAGLPASRKADEMRHLLESADGEQCRLLWEHMGSKQRDHFVAQWLPDRLDNFHKEWACKSDTVLQGNRLAALHAAGVDFTKRRRYDRDAAYLHNVPFREDERRWVFLTLHTLGVYDKELRHDGFTALHVAAQANDGPAIRALAQRGHELDAMSLGRPGSKDGATALAIAARVGNGRAVEALLEVGADTGLKTAGGKSLMQVTRDESIKRMINAARSAGAVERAMPDQLEQGAATMRDMGAVL